MNHVNLIGQLCSTPRILDYGNGKRVAHFSMKTDETVLTPDGKSQKRSQWHQIKAWGKWVRVLEELSFEGMNLAIEGKLTTRFYRNQGRVRCISEVEVNDLVII